MVFRDYFYYYQSTSFVPLFRAPRGQKIPLKRLLELLKKSPGATREALFYSWKPFLSPEVKKCFSKGPRGLL
jgi:hypothetical protein